MSGIKGIGEAGAIGAPPAIVNAVLDALAPLGVTHLDMPLYPEQIRAAIRQTTTAGSFSGGARYTGRLDYLCPATVVEALEMAPLNDGAMFLAGGHALLPERKLRHTPPLTLIDLGRIAELRGSRFSRMVLRRSRATARRAGRYVLAR